MQLTKREMDEGWRRRFVILVGVGLVLGWMGPFGTYVAMTPVQRFAYWGFSIPLIGLVARYAIRVVVRHGPTAHWPFAARVALGSALAGCPGPLLTFILLSTVWKNFPFDVTDLLGTYATVTASIFVVGLPLATIAARRRQQTEAAAAPAPAEAVSPFFRRLPAKLGTDLLSLSAEDHYIRVTTALGSDLVLCRLSDAITEIGAEKGQRVHRSHWVAQGAVASVDRQNGKATFVLTNGESIPVSQSYMASLREAGWL